jgi:protein transport protein SEC31
MPIFTVISGELQRLRETTPPQQKRLVDDLERRVSPLFDALNCETLPQPVVGQLLELSQAMAAHDRDTAAQIHMQLITTGSGDMGLPLSVVKQLIARL